LVTVALLFVVRVRGVSRDFWLLGDQIRDWGIALGSPGSLPLIGPGKVNVRALPDPGKTRPDLEVPFALPRDPVEEKIVKIWSEILGLNEVGIHDRFLELGGDSLLATRVISRIIVTFRCDLPMRTFFAEPTVAALAAVVARNETKPSTSEKIKRAPRSKHIWK